MLPAASSPYSALLPGNLVSNGPANVALVSLSALRWHPFLHHAGGITSIVLSSSPALRWHHCLHCTGIFALIALDLSPTLHPHCHKHCKLVSASSRCNRDTSAYMALSLCSLSLSVVFVAVTGAVPWQLGPHVQPILRWWLCQSCAGVLACVTLASLQALRCQCQHCAGIVTNVALTSLPSLRWHCPQHRKLAYAQPRHSRDTSMCMVALSWSSSLPVASLLYLALLHGDLASDGPSDAALVSLPALCWRPWPYCTGVITNIALSLLPALCRHHCPHCVGTFALIVLALLPLSPLRCHQHCKLASPQSQSSHSTRWHHCQHCTIVVASVATASLPLLRGCVCPCCTSVAALGTPALPTASRTGIWPVMMQLRHVIGEAFLVRSTLLPVALSLYPASAHSDWAFNSLAKAAMAFFGVALVSLPALHWHHCQRQAVLVTGVALVLLPSWPLKVRPVPRWRLQALCWRFAHIALLSLPALCCCPCHQCCAGVIALVAWALSPLLRCHCCPCRLCVAASIANWRLP